MNIAFIYFRPFVPEYGGVERVTDILAKELIKKGHNVKYLSFYKLDTDYKLPVENYYFPNQEYINEENIVFLKKFTENNDIDICIIQEPDFCNDIYKLFLQQRQFKVISVFHSCPALGLRFYWKGVLHKQSSNTDFYLKLLPRLVHRVKIRRDLKKMRYAAIKGALDYANKAVFLSKKFKPDFNLIGISPNMSKFEYIGNPSTYKATTEIPPKEKIILMVGRFESLKNQDMVINIWKKIAHNYPDWNLYLAGDGDKIGYCRKRASACDQIKFLGQCDPEEYYEKASILCMASNNEGWPMVLFEAMSKGCVPIVFESFRSVTDIIDNYTNGVLVRPFSKKQYRKELRHLIEDEPFRRTLAINAIEKVKQFSPEIIVDKWIQLFDKVMSDN